MWIGYVLGSIIIGLIGVVIAMFLGWSLPALFVTFYACSALGWMIMCSSDRGRKALG